MSKKRGEMRRQARGRGDPPPIEPIVVPEVVPEVLREDVAWVLDWKNHVVDQNLWNGDISPAISIWRDGDLLLHAYTPTVDRDQGLWFLDRAVAGYNADAAVMYCDTHQAGGKWFEQHGRNPDPHELMHLCADEGACELGLITDAIFAIYAERAKPEILQCLMFPYHVNHNVNRVHWQDDVTFMDSSEPTVELQGFIPDVVRHIMWTDEVGSKLTDAMMSIGDPVHTRFMMDMYLTAQFAMTGYAVLWHTRTPEERAYVDETMRSLGVGEQPTQEPSAAMQYMAAKNRLLLRERSEHWHAADLAEAARRQQERGETPRPWTQPKN